jgi:hypothetical protein
MGIVWKLKVLGVKERIVAATHGDAFRHGTYSNST